MRPWRAVLSGVVLLVGLTAAATVVGQPCVIDFDTTCPDIAAECDAVFTGGLGCQIAGLAFCYDTGSRAYRVTDSAPLTITFAPGLEEIDVFFAHTGTAQGTMTFFDAVQGGSMVGVPLVTNGDCGAAMPARQQVAFPTPVLRIEVTATAGGDVWIDTMTLTKVAQPVDVETWGQIKSLFGD